MTKITLERLVLVLDSAFTLIVEQCMTMADNELTEKWTVSDGKKWLMALNIGIIKQWRMVDDDQEV